MLKIYLTVANSLFNEGILFHADAAKTGIFRVTRLTVLSVTFCTIHTAH